jgi:hypothetical protein
MSGAIVNQETMRQLAAVREALSQRLSPDIVKATYSQPSSAISGLNSYDLEIGAKMLYPVLTPLRNDIPRVPARGGIQANWRAVTAINTAGLSMGVGEGNRSGVIAVSTADYTAKYTTMGLESSASFQADWAAEYFQDVKALASLNLLQSVMIGEEKLILGGNSSVALGKASAPGLTASSSNGSLGTNANFSVIVVYLSLEGYLNASVAGGIQAQVTRLNADGSSDSYGGGAGIKSNNTTVGTTGPSGSVAATTTAKAGAFGYAWFWGDTAGTEVLGAITTEAQYTITAEPTGTQTAASLPAATDYSTNSLVIDGYLTQVVKSGSNAYVSVMANGATLTADNAGGIVEIDAALKSFWDNYRLSPSDIWVSSQEQTNISKKVLSTSSSSPGAQRFVFTADQSQIVGGVMATSYRNKYSLDGAKEIPIRLHPNMPAGTIFFNSKQLPYPMSNVTNITQMRLRRDYWQIEWPLRSLKYEYGIYLDGVMQCYFPPALGIITNIHNG